MTQLDLRQMDLVGEQAAMPEDRLGAACWCGRDWMPAFAGMTEVEDLGQRRCLWVRSTVSYLPKWVVGES